MTRRVTPRSAELTDAERAEIERLCRKGGMDAETARYIAYERVGRATAPPPGHPAAESRAVLHGWPRAVGAATKEGLRSVCASFRAEALVPDFERAGIPLKNAVAMLERASYAAANGQRVVSPVGAEQVRMGLLQQTLAANDAA